MNFAGEENLGRPREELWDRLTDMSFVASLIPDLERIEQIESDKFVCRVRPQFSFLSASLRLTFEILEADQPKLLKVRSRGKGIGASVDVEAVVNLAEQGDGTTLQWTGVIAKREGLLRPISAGLIQAAAQKVIGDFWTRFRSALGEDADPTDKPT